MKMIPFVLTRAVADDKRMRLTADGWLTNGHWCVRESLVKRPGDVARTPIEDLRAAYPWGSFDTMDDMTLVKPGGVVEPLDMDTMQRWRLTHLLTTHPAITGRTCRLLVSEHAQLGGIDERYVQFLKLDLDAVLFASKPMRRGWAKDLAPGALWGESMGPVIVMPMRVESDLLAPFTLSTKVAAALFSKRAPQAPQEPQDGPQAPEPVEAEA